MSLLEALQSTTRFKTPTRMMPTGLLLVDKMITGIPLRGITLLMGESRIAIKAFMDLLVSRADEYIPRKYTCVTDSYTDADGILRIYPQSHVDCVDMFLDSMATNGSVFGLSYRAMSIDVPSDREAVSKLLPYFGSDMDNALVVYMDQQVGVPKMMVDWMIMQATCVLKFSDVDQISLDVMRKRCAQHTPKFADRIATFVNGVRITTIKRQLSSSLLRTACFPFGGGGLSDAMSVFYYLLETGVITMCDANSENEFYCCKGLNKFTIDEWSESFEDLRSLLANQL